MEETWQYSIVINEPFFSLYWNGITFFTEMTFNNNIITLFSVFEALRVVPCSGIQSLGEPSWMKLGKMGEVVSFAAVTGASCYTCPSNSCLKSEPHSLTLFEGWEQNQVMVDSQWYQLAWHSGSKFIFQSIKGMQTM